MQKVPSYRNPDFAPGDGNVARWNRPDFRRHAFHNMHRVTRYAREHLRRPLSRSTESAEVSHVQI